MSIPEDTEGPTSLSTGQILGVVVTEENVNEIEYICKQALRHGRDVLLVCPESLLGTLPEITDSPGVSVVDTPFDNRHDLDTLSADLDESLRSRCVFVDATTQVDFDQEGIEQEPRDTELPASETLIAVPAYNEELTIGNVVDTALDHTGQVVVIDDGSEDGTIREAWRADADVVAHARNRGYGAALQTAFEVASERNAEQLVILDGDGQHNPADVPDLVATLEENGANVVIGSRFVGESSGDIPLYRRFGLVVINVLTNLTLGNLSRESWIHDTQCGFRAYDRDAIEQLASEGTIGDDMGASLDILYQLSEHDREIEEHPVVVNYDVPSGSSQNPITHGFGLILTILRTTVRKHPVAVAAVAVLLLALIITSLYVASVALF